MEAEPFVPCRPLSSENPPSELPTPNLHCALGIACKERLGVSSKPSVAVSKQNINPPQNWVSERKAETCGDDLHNNHPIVTFSLERFPSLAKKVFFLLLMWKPDMQGVTAVWRKGEEGPAFIYRTHKVLLCFSPWCF